MSAGPLELKKEVCPPKNDPPMRKKDETWMLVTASNLLKQLYLGTYQKRLEQRLMKPELMDIFFLKEELWSWTLEELRNKKTAPWNLSELKIALKSFKNNKTADPHGMINELFKSSCGGSDLEESLLLLYNGIKENFFSQSIYCLRTLQLCIKTRI